MEVVELEMTEFPVPVSRTTRSNGLHLTPIIHDLLQTLAGKEEVKNSFDPQFYWECGYLFEDMMGEVMARRYVVDHPGEAELDGVVGSPDGIVVITTKLVVVEYKWTSKSMRNLPETNRAWLMQNMGYCKMLGSTSGRFVVMYNNGDYKPPRPTPYACDIHYTAGELDENWMMIVNHAKYRGWL